jgi:hypothetical protein
VRREERETSWSRSRALVRLPPLYRIRPFTCTHSDAHMPPPPPPLPTSASVALSVPR